MKEVWCQVKSSDNAGGPPWQICQRCCCFCEDEECSLRVCRGKATKELLCCWRASPAEWLMGRMDYKAKMFAYNRRMYENYVRRGIRPGDGSWEGDRLAEFWKKYPKVYQEIFEEESK